MTMRDLAIGTIFRFRFDNEGSWTYQIVKIIHPFGGNYMLQLTDGFGKPELAICGAEDYLMDEEIIVIS
jgi:hypothetical protein